MDWVSDFLCDSPTLWNEVLPVVEVGLLLAFSLEDFLILRVLIGCGLLSLSLSLFSFEGFCHFNLSELLKRHGWEVVARLEHLLLILSS